MQDHVPQVIPTLLDVEAVGGADSRIVQLTNNSSEAILVEVAATEIEPDYSRSVFEHCTVELRSPEVMEIAPRRTGRAVLVIRAPRDEGIGGGYYGYIEVTARSAEDGGVLGQQDILLRTVVPENVTTEARVNSAIVIPNEEDLSLSVVVENLGNVHLIPLSLTSRCDRRGHQDDSPSPQEGMDQILPSHSGYLVGDGWLVDSERTRWKSGC